MNTDTAIPTHTMEKRRLHVAERCQYEAYQLGLNLNAYLEARGMQPADLYRLSLTRLVDLHILLTSQFSPVPMLDDCEPEYETLWDDEGPDDNFDYDDDAPPGPRPWDHMSDEIPF
jgi:hypothetical protein